MTHPEDIRSFLKAKLEDRNPKCANCRYWNQLCPTRGQCGLDADSTGPGTTIRIADLGYTTDLTVCSAWEQKKS